MKLDKLKCVNIIRGYKTNKRKNSLLLLLSFSSSGSPSGQETHASTYVEYISKLKRLSEEK